MNSIRAKTQLRSFYLKKEGITNLQNCVWSIIRNSLSSKYNNKKRLYNLIKNKMTFNKLWNTTCAYDNTNNFFGLV